MPQVSKPQRKRLATLERQDEPHPPEEPCVDLEFKGPIAPLQLKLHVRNSPFRTI